jgi:hypothetical protein
MRCIAAASSTKQFCLLSTFKSVTEHPSIFFAPEWANFAKLLKRASFCGSSVTGCSALQNYFILLKKTIVILYPKMVLT